MVSVRRALVGINGCLLLALFFVPCFSLAKAVGADDLNAPAYTVEDNVLQDYNAVKTVKSLLYRLARKMSPGDDLFLMRKLSEAPELKNAELPRLFFDHGIFSLRSNHGETTIHLEDSEHFEFEVNRQKITLNPATLAAYRWIKIGDSLVQIRNSSITFMPVAFAVENGQATVSSIVTMAITSAIAHGHASGYNIRLRSSDGAAILTDIWKKSLEKPSACGPNFFQTLSKKMAELQVSEMSCEEKPTSNSHAKDATRSFIDGNILFAMPFGDGSTRSLRLITNEATLEEKAPDLAGQTVTYRRVRSPDPLDKEFEQSLGDGGRRHVVRERGFQWQPVGSNDDQLKIRSEQLRELAEVAYSTDACRRCGMFFKRQILQVMKENPTQVITEVSPLSVMAPSTTSVAAPNTAPGATTTAVPNAAAPVPQTPAVAPVTK